ncbi:hypothetical protein FBU30_006144 [Linnemannia zychae]|nr:hypothetical protein FBU30_006144 [Linnemannia zychae]
MPVITASPIPVLIAGAGPVGLYEALLLTQIGIPVRIIERESAVSPHSRALGLHARTMEIMQFTGIVDPLVKSGRPFTEISYYRNARIVGTLPMWPATGQSEFSAALFIEQSKASEIFSDKLRKLGVSVEFGWELLDTKVVTGQGGEEDYVETIIRRALTGGNVRKGEDQVIGDIEMQAEQMNKEYETQVVKSKYLVACDGGRSAVRHKLNIAFPGTSHDLKTLMWDGLCECDIPMDGFAAIRGPNGKTVIVFPLNSGYVRLGIEDCDLATGESFDQTLQELTVERFETLVAETVYPAKFKVKETTWLTCFRVNERRAENYVHKNRIFLAGDAAHVHSPSGGQGLNTGLQDAHNLAWKLGFVLNGLAKPGFLLPTYEERGAMGDRSIRLSSHLMFRNRNRGFMADLKSYLFFSIGPIISRFSKIFLFPSEISMLDVKYTPNNLNRPHETQSAPAPDYQVGVRAKDGILLPFHPLSSSKERDPQAIMHLHSLFTGVVRFHIIVFTSDAFNITSSYDTKDLQQLLDQYINQWHSKFKYATPLLDGYNDKDLFKVNILVGPSDSSNNGLEVLSKRSVGEGKLFVDINGDTHACYGFASTKAQGGIVVVRPDSHIGYRVNGIGEQSWRDVDTYFSTILVSQSE